MEEKILDTIYHVNSQAKRNLPIKISCHIYENPQLLTLNIEIIEEIISDMVGYVDQMKTL